MKTIKELKKQNEILKNKEMENLNSTIPSIELDASLSILAFSELESCLIKMRHLKLFRTLLRPAEISELMLAEALSDHIDENLENFLLNSYGNG